MTEPMGADENAQFARLPFSGRTHPTDRRRGSRGCGFTLLELMAALCVAALAASVVAVACGRLLGPALMRRDVDRFCRFDATTRRSAIRSGDTQEVVIDLHTGLIRCTKTEDDRPLRKALLGHAPIRVVKTAADSWRRGEVTIPYATKGKSPTFAVQLEGRRRPVWLLIAGLTGQIQELENEGEVDEALSQASGLDRD